MRSEHQPELRKISKVSKLLLPLLYLTFATITAMLVLVPFLTLTSPTSGGEPILGNLWSIYVTPDQIETGQLTLSDKLKLLSAIFIFSGFALPGLWFAIRLIKEFKRNNLFTPDGIRYSRCIAWLYLGWVVTLSFTYLFSSFSSDGMEIHINPISFSKEFVILGLLWLFVWMLEIGTALHADNEMTI